VADIAEKIEDTLPEPEDGVDTDEYGDTNEDSGEESSK